MSCLLSGLIRRPKLDAVYFGCYCTCSTWQSQNRTVSKSYPLRTSQAILFSVADQGALQETTSGSWCINALFQQPKALSAKVIDKMSLNCGRTNSFCAFLFLAWFLCFNVNWLIFLSSCNVHHSYIWQFKFAKLKKNKRRFSTNKHWDLQEQLSMAKKLMLLCSNVGLYKNDNFQQATSKMLAVHMLENFV